MKWENYVDEWIQMHQDGISCTEISKKYKTNHPTVRYWLKKRNIEIKRIYARGDKHGDWTGYGDITGKFWSYVNISARRRNMKLWISKKEAWELFVKQDGKCALTGRDLILRQDVKNLAEVTASLDRIDSSKGYTIDNVQWIHKVVQLMKHIFSQEQYIQICYDVTRMHKEPETKPNFDGVLKRKPKKRGRKLIGFRKGR